MLTKSDFIEAAYSNIEQYPALSLSYKAKDPRLTQNIEAIATMLAMLSSQIEVSQAERFEKTRDSTVLADSAMRGIIPKGTPTVLNIDVDNTGGREVVLSKGREIIDNSGRYLYLDHDVVVKAKSSIGATCSQFYVVSSQFTVRESKPFYEIPISLSNDESVLCGLTVLDGDGYIYSYADRYSNINSGERIYHIEVDEKRNFYIRFGYKNIVGVQLDVGAVITIKAAYTKGYIDDYVVGDNLSLSVGNIFESDLKIKVESVRDAGTNPISIELLRELSKYPSIYNKNAVYLGEFDFLVRSSISNLSFLSVWNEAIEEMARGAKVENINCLFVAVVGSDFQEDFEWFNGKAPEEFNELTKLQSSIKGLILQADSSYRVRFVKPLVELVDISIDVKVASPYDPEAIKKQIEEKILARYGRGSIEMARGRKLPLYKDIYDFLTVSIPALSVIGTDLRVSIGDSQKTMNLPEVWRYVDSSSLKVSVASQNVSATSWGFGF